MLELRDVETAYGRSQVLFGVSLQIGKGEVVSLLGRNGMGKTTTVNSIMGLADVRAGSIAFDDVDLRVLPPHRIARLGLGLVPEGRQAGRTGVVQRQRKSLRRQLLLRLLRK